jgi:hypothetical protein
MKCWSELGRIAVCDAADQARWLLDSARRSLICVLFRTRILKSSRQIALSFKYLGSR